VATSKLAGMKDVKVKKKDNTFAKTDGQSTFDLPVFIHRYHDEDGLNFGFVSA